MERITSIFVSFLIVLFVVGNEMYIVNGDSPYACWGGCYNKCILLTMKSRVPSGNDPCYVKCLSKCIPTSSSEYKNYCTIGCSLELCVAFRFDAGEDLDACYGNCGRICRV
uniref:Knottin scorpion toxin-like domain-containing protein n=1 Tax=Solanum lycopersicum TaxID=4081 RepID=A0A3Q7HRT6_SOLLC